MQIEKELAVLLASEGLPNKIEFERLRPAEIHPKAVEAFNDIKKQLAVHPNDFRWLTTEMWPALYYLERYHFLSLEWDTEIVGFDRGYSQMVCKSWLTDIRLTEDEGNEHLSLWCDQPRQG
jgi:hypothetical protein